MTRKKDSFWEYAERLNGRRFKCNFCGRDFAGGIPRVKSHLSGIRGRDIGICTEVPRDVQLAAAATIKAIRKRPKTEAFSSNSDENSFEACEKNDSRLPDSLLAKFFLLNNIDYGVVKSPSFIDFVNAVVTFGPAYNLPSYSTLENVTIPSLLGEVKEHVSNVKESWGETGCTLLSDIWCDEEQNMSFINIVACSLKGAVLLDTLEIPKHKLTSEFLVVIINFLIQKVGADNVVQYINGAQGMVPSGSLLADRYPHMYVTQCVAAEIQSLFEEVYSKIEWVQAAFDNARCLVSHIYGDSNLLSLARQYTNDKELRQPQLREFSSNYDMLLSIVDARSELLQLVQSSEWLSFGYDTQELGKEVTEIIHSSEFWNRVQEVVMALESLCIVLYTVDKYGSSSGYLYWVMEIATEKIRRIYDVNPTKYQWIWEIFNSRKGRIVHPIHIAAAFLNPACMCTKMFRDKIEVIEVMNFLVRQLVADEDKEAFVEQMMVYHSREPALFSDIPNIMMKTFHPCKWWDYCGHKLPVLRKYAIRILSQPCSTLVCKQSLTAFKGAQMKQQQKFALETPYSHLSLRMNMILTANFIARDTSNKPIDLTDLDRLKLIDRSFSNDLLNGAGVPRLHLQPCYRSPFSSEQYPDQKELQVQFVTGISYFQVTGQEVKGEHGSPIHVFMVDIMTGDVVQDDTLSMLWLTVSALQGDFDEEARNDWTREDFEENEIMDVPLMSGELQLTLKKGMGTLGAVTFNYDSSITRSGKFRIGVKTATGHNEGIRIREGISSAFVVEYAKVSGRHDAAANHTCLPDDSQPTIDMDEMAWPWGPLQNTVDGETVFYDQFFESMWNAEVIHKHKQKVSIKSRQAAIRWLKLKAILQWAILRKLVARKRTQRMIIWTLVHKRLQKWSKGSRWTIEEHERFLSGLQGLGKHDWTYISEKYVISKTPAQVESHAKKYFDYRSRIGIDEEKKHMLVQPEHLFKEEQELINPTDLSVEDPARFPRPVVSQQSHPLTLFPSLLCEHGAETNDNEVSEIFIQKGGDKKVLNQSEPTKSTNEDAGKTPLDLDRSGPINSLTVLPKLLTERGDETAEEFIMLTETEQMLSTRPAEVDQLNGKSACSSAADSVSSSEVNSSFKKIRLSLLQAIAGLRKKPHSPRYSVSPNPKLTRLGDMDLNFNQVLKATQNFSPSMQIGKGTFGIVYRGQLEGGQVVAIKRAKRDHFKDPRNEFGQNLELLVKIDHQNLVKLLGFIDKGNECLIVTEYVPNGTLRAHLDGHRDTILDFNRRLGIAIDVAHGLTYLHMYSEKQIIHRDVKSSNILLTDSMRAKVADFGFAMLGAEDSVPTHVSTSVKGTVGSLDPEYMRTLRLTAKSDVYSFGILLLEILTGRRPVEPNRPNDERVTLRWAFKKLEEGSVLDLVDPRMEEVVDRQILVRFVELAIRCAAPVRSDRPDMKSVGEQLGGIRAEYYKRPKRGSQA